ncbi:MAG TPA: hypothetical protein PLJ60_16505 [Chryseolinea sp.]|nr:hypothetical protein [Chryseolinea sp.]HPH46364.1 hypothetical protein [Chryseolinea sp.]HPM31939.1 hypothetical protein [Chryseolinea sp.]
MSHAKNVEAFEKLLGICTGYGEEYKPGSTNLRTERLSDLLTRAKAAMLSVSKAKTGFENATDQREVTSNEINQLVSRAFAELKSSGALPQSINNARVMVRKIKGRSAGVSRPSLSPAIKATLESDASPPVSMLTRIYGSDYGSTIYHFEKLLQTLASEPLYQPGAPQLQVQNLNEKLTTFRNQNAMVNKAFAELSKTRSERNAVLYVERNSLYNTAMAVKQQMKAVFGFGTEVAHAAGRIRFRKSL